MLAQSKQLAATVEAMLGDGPDGHDLEEAEAGLEIARRLVDALDFENEQSGTLPQEAVMRSEADIRVRVAQLELQMREDVRGGVDLDPQEPDELDAKEWAVLRWVLSDPNGEVELNEAIGIEKEAG